MNVLRNSSQQGQVPQGLGRRDFIKAAGVTAVGAGLAQRPLNALASTGGTPAVTIPAERINALTRWPRYAEAERENLLRVHASGCNYNEIKVLEKEWAAYTGSPFAKSYINGSSSLASMYFALSLDVKPGSEVMVPSYTFVTATLALRFSNLRPIFVDIDPKTACFDLEDAKRKLTPNTVAVEVMHSWGLPCEMDKIFGWAKEHGLVTLEDGSHAHGASMQGKKIGNWGDMAAFSMQGSKVLPAIEGGVGNYQTRDFFERASALGHYEAPEGFPKTSAMYRYRGTGFGQKYRMHPYAAAVVRPQLKTLDERNAIIRKNVKALNARLTQLEGIAEPVCRADQERVYYSCNMLMMDFAKLGFTRDALVKALKAEGVRVHFWDYPLQHKMPVYTESQWWHTLPTIPQHMPGGDYVNANHIMLPLFCGEAEEVNDQYAKAFEKVWAHRGTLAKE